MSKKKRFEILPFINDFKSFLMILWCYLMHNSMITMSPTRIYIKIYND